MALVNDRLEVSMGRKGTCDFIIGELECFVIRLESFQAEDVKVPLIWVVGLKVTNFTSQRNRS
jgi:hypothetical protein